MTRRELLENAVALAAAPRKKSTLRDRLAEGEPLNDLNIIDVHAHVDETPPGAVWPRSAAALVDDMARCGIRVAVFSHLSAIMATAPEELRLAHDNSAAAVRRYPDRLRAYIVFHPHLLDTSLAELERILPETSPFVGVKLHGPIHRYPLTGPAWARAFRFAHEHRLPVLCHLPEGTDTKTVLAVAGEYSGMKLILAHLWPGGALAASVTHATPNLFFDTCGSVIGRGAMARLIRSAGDERILFGTDSTYLQAGGQLAKVGFADVSDETKKRVFSLNARKLFRNLPRLPGD